MRIGTHAKAGIDNQSLITGFSIIYTFAMFISKNMDYQNLSDEQFKRRFGVYRQTYRKMVGFFVTWYGSIGGHKSTKSLSGKRLN